MGEFCFTDDFITVFTRNILLSELSLPALADCIRWSWLFIWSLRLCLPFYPELAFKHIFICDMYIVSCICIFLSIYGGLEINIITMWMYSFIHDPITIMVWQISFNKWDPMRLPMLKCIQQQKFNTARNILRYLFTLTKVAFTIYETYLPTDCGTKWIND